MVASASSNSVICVHGSALTRLLDESIWADVRARAMHEQGCLPQFTELGDAGWEEQFDERRLAEIVRFSCSFIAPAS